MDVNSKIRIIKSLTLYDLLELFVDKNIRISELQTWIAFNEKLERYKAFPWKPEAFEDNPFIHVPRIAISPDNDTNRNNPSRGLFHKHRNGNVYMIETLLQAKTKLTNKIDLEKI